MRIITDTSDYQAGTDWHALAGSVDAAWAKAGDWAWVARHGWPGDDVQAATFAAFNAVGRPVGSYLFVRPGWTDPNTQISQWRQNVPGGYQVAPMIDLEDPGVLSGGSLTAWVDEALALTAQHFGRTPVLYWSQRFQADNGMGMPGTPHIPMVAEYHRGYRTFEWGWGLAEWERWAYAAYGGPDVPSGYPYGSGDLIWQFTSSAQIPGPPGLIDCSFVPDRWWELLVVGGSLGGASGGGGGQSSGAPTGGDVGYMQTFLRDHGCDPGPIDGAFGPQTEAGVRCWQTFLNNTIGAGLAVDGDWGPLTTNATAAWLAGQAPPPAPAPAPTPAPAPAGVPNGGDVGAVQAWCRDHGCDPGPVDGVNGPQTRAGVSCWQQKLAAAGFDPGPIDGDWGPLTTNATAAWAAAGQAPPPAPPPPPPEGEMPLTDVQAGQLQHLFNIFNDGDRWAAWFTAAMQGRGSGGTVCFVQDDRPPAKIWMVFGTMFKRHMETPEIFEGFKAYWASMNGEAPPLLQWHPMHIDALVDVGELEALARGANGEAFADAVAAKLVAALAGQVNVTASVDTGAIAAGVLAQLGAALAPAPAQPVQPLAVRSLLAAPDSDPAVAPVEVNQRLAGAIGALAESLADPDDGPAARVRRDVEKMGRLDAESPLTADAIGDAVTAEIAETMRRAGLKADVAGSGRVSPPPIPADSQPVDKAEPDAEAATAPESPAGDMAGNPPADETTTSTE